MEGLFYNRSFESNMTFNGAKCHLFLIFGKDDKEYIKVSIPEYEIYSIPIYFFSEHENRIEFYIWDSPLLGKCIFIDSKGKYYLYFCDVAAIKEKKIELRESSFPQYDMCCGKIKDYLVYQDELRGNRYIQKPENIHYEFVYENAEYEKLIRLLNRKAIEKCISDFDKALYVMRFLHKLIISNGETAFVPQERSGLSLLNLRMKKDIQLNCRGCAIILNDVLLSIGIPSKFIACMSANPFDPECHVTNSVYIKEFNKWIMLDSAIQAYVEGENGIPMSIYEIRSKIIQGERLKFMAAPGIANENLRKCNFENYLIKNMFCFLSYIKYEPNCDAWNNKNKKLLLLPYQKETLYLHLNFKYTNTHITYNANAFFGEGIDR